MAELTTEDLLEEMAIRATTLVANPASPPARAAMKRSLQMWRAWKARRALPTVAAEADSEAREQRGFRADVDG